MTNPIVTAVFCTLLLFAGPLIHPDGAVASSECSRLCISMETACRENAKDSPNDIDRELCDTERKECLLKCDEEYKKKMEHAEKERALKAEEQKAVWESQGLTEEEQQEKKEKQKAIEREKRHEEREVSKEQRNSEPEE